MFIFLTLGLNIGRCWLLWDDRCFGSRFRQALPTHPGGWTALTACILQTHGNSRSVLTVWWEGQSEFRGRRGTHHRDVVREMEGRVRVSLYQLFLT